MSAADAIFETIKKLELPEDATERQSYYQKVAELEGTFRARLAAEHLTVDIPADVASKVYSLAYQHGHASGYHEIESYYQDFAPLANAAYTAGKQ